MKLQARTMKLGPDGAFSQIIEDEQQEQVNEAAGAPDIEEDQEHEALEERIEALAAGLKARRDQWIAARQSSGWDRQLKQDLDAYHMRDKATASSGSTMMDVVRSGGPLPQQAGNTRSTIFVGITRQKTNAAEARLVDIVLPTDDRNWGIQPTPDPEGLLAKEVDGQLMDLVTGQPVLFDSYGRRTTDPELGKPITKKEIATASERVARAAAAAMQREIEDQLVECGYLQELRKVIHDAATTGTGVLRGPIVQRTARKAWTRRTDASGASFHVLEMVETIRPASVRVDPALVWEDPDCGDDVQNGQGVFELSQLTARQVRDLAKNPGYLSENIAKALKDGPQKARTIPTPDETHQPKVYEHWTYTGDVEREEFVAAGFELPDQEEDEDISTVSVVIEMIGDHVVRAFVNPLEDGALPYDFFPWEKVAGKVRGYGVPYLMRAEQSVTNAAWRQLMDNSGYTAGPQIVMRRKAVTPADGSYVLRPGKLWFANEDITNVRDAFASVEFNSHQAELENIIEMAAKLGDQSSGVPALVTGNQGQAPETVGGMQVLMSNANVVLRRLVKQFDDMITRPHIRRYYDFNMAYSDKEEIKGDFQIDARGSTSLVVRDIQNQALTNLAGAAANGVYAPMVNHKKLFEKLLQAQHLDPKELMNDDETIERNMQAASQQKDPRVEAAMLSAQARVQQAQAVAQGRAVETEVMREAEVANRELRLQLATMQREVELLKLMQNKDLTLEQIKATLASIAMQERTRKELAASEAMFAERKTDALPTGGNPPQPAEVDNPQNGVS